ncbi:MAG: YggT family protein [Chloroflexi bacterium]|nr:YggT family protein [Ktedonobacteraceae bacterium]MBV8822009.1 YggT family protein [Ktedonobacteraceae bacterium]MBV9708490.1 YggT family protein [Chloroflexota bacterium]
MFGFPVPIVHWLVQFGIGLLIIAMFIRAIASWVRIDERNGFIRFLARLTDPFIDPVRRIVRPVGVLDLSFIITWFLLGTLQILLIQALPNAW